MEPTLRALELEVSSTKQQTNVSYLPLKYVWQLLFGCIVVFVVTRRHSWSISKCKHYSQAAVVSNYPQLSEKRWATNPWQAVWWPKPIDARSHKGSGVWYKPTIGLLCLKLLISEILVIRWTCLHSVHPTVQFIEPQRPDKTATSTFVTFAQALSIDWEWEILFAHCS